MCTRPETTFPLCLPAFYALAIPVSCYITLVLVCCVCFLTLAGKTIIVYTASLFAQKRKDLTTFASSAITTVLCSAIGPSMDWQKFAALACSVYQLL